MEACPGLQWLAQKIQTLRHTVRILPAQFVKRYLKFNKNDIIGAGAIADAVTRLTMRFVEIKGPDHVDPPALHRISSVNVTAPANSCIKDFDKIKALAHILALDLHAIAQPRDRLWRWSAHVERQVATAERGKDPPH
jgi:hypothetical protein